MNTEVIKEIDAALESPAPTEPRPQSKLSALLRRLGAVLLLAAGGTFLFQGWGGMDSLQRLYAFLSFTASLGLTGLFCGLKLHDDKGARVSLGVALLLVPITFLQLGALIYSLVGGLVPRYSAFVLTTTNVFGLSLAAGMVVAVSLALVYLAFAALARAEVPALLAGYALGNLALLVPLRDPNLVGVIVLALFAAILARDLGHFCRQPALKTREGKLSRLVLFVPLALLVVRNVALYEPTTLFASTLFGALAAGLFLAVPRYSSNQELAKSCQALSVLPLFIAWAGMVRAVFYLGLPWSISAEYAIPLTFLPYAGMLLGMSFYAVGEGIGYRRLAAWVAVGSVALQLMAYGNVASSFLCIVTSVGALVLGSTFQEKGLFYAGGFGLGVGIVYHLHYAIEVAQLLSPWVSLAVFGIALVVGSSYLERNGRQVLERVKQVRGMIQGWR